MTAAAAAITADFGRNLDLPSPVAAQRRGRPSGSVANHPPTSFSYGRHRSAPRTVGRAGIDGCENSGKYNLAEPSTPLSKARREFFQANIDVQNSEHLAEHRRRNKASDTSSGYGSNSSGESDAADDINRLRHDSSGQESIFGHGRIASSCPESPEARGQAARGHTAFSSPSSSSSANSLTFSSGASLGGCGQDVRSTYTDEILKVLEEDGLILQTTYPRDNLSPLPTSMSERRASADYNVIELSRQYRKKELSQLRASGDKFQQITDTYRLQQLMESTEDEEKRRAIRQRLSELKTIIRNKENTHPNGQRMRSFSTREMASSSANDERKYNNFGSPIRDPAMLGGIASLTLPTSSGTAGSSPSSPASHKSLTPNGQTTKIIARTPAEIKAALLRWCQIKTRGYPNVLITNFTRSWCDGMAFCALVHHFFPNAFDFSTLDIKNRRENFDLAFRMAEELAGIVPLLDVDDMITMGDTPEYKCIYTYVQAMYRNLHTLG